MGTTAEIQAVRIDIEPTRADLERRIREVYARPYIEEAELYEYSVGIVIWQFLASAFMRDTSREPLDLYGRSDSPLTWAICGRSEVTSYGMDVNLNAPEDVRAIHERIEALPETELIALLQAEYEALVAKYMAEGIDLERAQGLLGDPEMRYAKSLCAGIAAFYRRAAAEGRYVACVFG